MFLVFLQSMQAVAPAALGIKCQVNFSETHSVLQICADSDEGTLFAF
jgi:hypothetical protein